MNSEDWALGSLGSVTASAAGGITAANGKRGLLLVDDNENHCWALTRAFEKRGYTVKAAHSAPAACRLLEDEHWHPDYAVVDLRMPGPTGLTLIPRLKAALPNVRIVVLTGYASIATAVEAIKLGAMQYLVKPADANAVESAFHHEGADSTIPSNDHLLSVERLEWEYIQRVLAEHAGNVSATARALKMHRKTLQRKLGKHPAAR
jgi:two-component system, response regulator RegA